MRFSPLTAREKTDVEIGRPELVDAQLAPLVVETKTPASVPAKRFVPINAREKTDLFVSPVSFGVQLDPSFVERKTPPLPVPAKSFVPEIASARTSVSVMPLLALIQSEPLLVERKTPPFVPANTSTPLTAREWTYEFVRPEVIEVQPVPPSVDR
jgi:hypothetical protein